MTQPTTAESSKIVVGRCYECKEPFDEIDGSTVCTVCRDHVLVCSTCKTKCRNVYYCENHQYLKNTYYYFLDHFTVEELEGQLQRLRAIHQQMLVGTEKDAPAKEVQGYAKGEGCTLQQPRKKRKKCINKEKRKRGTKKFKNKRRTIMKQITKGGEAHQRPEQWSVHGSEGRVHGAARACGTLRFATGNAGGSGAIKSKPLNCPYG